MLELAAAMKAESTNMALTEMGVCWSLRNTVKSSNEI